MPASPALPIPTISPGEMQLLLSRAGLVLNPGQVADLVLAWRQIAGLIAAISHDRPLADDMALTFRLSPPTAGVAAPAVKGKAQRKGQKAKAKAEAKAPPRRRMVRSPMRKGARRSR